jgi:hypothetical protein
LIADTACLSSMVDSILMGPSLSILAFLARGSSSSRWARSALKLRRLRILGKGGAPTKIRLAINAEKTLDQMELLGYATVGDIELVARA